MINVWATWCGPCVTEFPELVTMHRMYRNRDFELVTITADAPENRDAALKFLEQAARVDDQLHLRQGRSLRAGRRAGRRVAGALPFTLVVKPGGEIVYKKMGPIDPLELRRAIVDELSRYYFKMEH